jgi:hypothetical protein
LFKIAYAVIKQFLSQKTVDKIRMLNTSAELINYFEKEELIPDHGGTSQWTYDPKTEFDLSTSDTTS